MAVNYVFTLNNYTEKEYKDFLSSDKYNYLIIGKEVGDSGTPHLQGYIQLKIKTHLNGVKKINNKAHLERARGSPDDNIEYCRKEGNFTEEGRVSFQGKRKLDLDKAIQQTIDR